MFPRSPALFLPPETVANSSGRLTPRVINTVWNEACRWANVKGKTPHAARHAMGRHIMQKTGNVAAVQRQLGPPTRCSTRASPMPSCKAWWTNGREDAPIVELGCAYVGRVTDQGS